MDDKQEVGEYKIKIKTENVFICRCRYVELLTLSVEFYKIS